MRRRYVKYNWNRCADGEKEGDTNENGRGEKMDRKWIGDDLTFDQFSTVELSVGKG